MVSVDDIKQRWTEDCSPLQLSRFSFVPNCPLSLTLCLKEDSGSVTDAGLINNSYGKLICCCTTHYKAEHSVFYNHACFETPRAETDVWFRLLGSLLHIISQIAERDSCCMMSYGFLGIHTKLVTTVTLHWQKEKSFLESSDFIRAWNILFFPSCLHVLFT